MTQAGPATTLVALAGMSLADTTPVGVRGPTQETRIAFIGNVDSGKSTLVSVLARGELDDGRGAARAAVFTHKHEHENGRTTTISMEVMGFGADGEQIVPKGTGRKASVKSRWTEVVNASVKVTKLIDLCGG